MMKRNPPLRPRIRVGLFCLAALFPLSVAFATEAVPPPVPRTAAALVSFFDTLRGLSGQFVQSSRSLDNHYSDVPTRRGHFLLLRPGRFRWSYDAPEQQELIADGRRLLIYDKDLEQLTIKSISGAAENSPAGLLTSQRPVGELFDVVTLPVIDGVAWFKLIPRQNNGTFRNTRLGLSNKQLREMVIEDEFGQITRFVFSELNSHPLINEDAFAFKPPPGTDIMDETTP